MQNTGKHGKIHAKHGKLQAARDVKGFFVKVFFLDKGFFDIFRAGSQKARFPRRVDFWLKVFFCVRVFLHFLRVNFWKIGRFQNR